MNIITVIQARTGSTRFPGKVLFPLAGKPVLFWITEAARHVPGINRVIVACPKGDTDIINWCNENNVPCHPGDEHNVLSRFTDIASAEDADIIMRLTADCPFLDPQVCGAVLASLISQNADYASNIEPRSWPDGLDCEVMTRDTLDKLSSMAVDTVDLEHVTSLVRRNGHVFRHNNIRCPVGNLAAHRWTLDTKDDLDFLENLLALLPAEKQTQPISYLELLTVLRASPELNELSLRGDPGDIPVPSNNHVGYGQSNALFDTASKRIPLGTQTFSKSWMMYPKGEGPLFMSHGRGAKTYDVDGNAYIDLINGLLPVVLGHCDPDVDAAIQRQLDAGITFSSAHELEYRVAEKLAKHIPCAGMTRFGKNGSDATSAAVRIARARTGRDRIAVCGYHGWQDWYIGSTTRDKGVPGAVKELTHQFPYNDLPALEKMLLSFPGEFAAVIMEPMNVEEPKPGYLAGVRDIAHRQGALLVFDEIITGFRFALGGAQTLFDVTPDLATFGKSMANGMPISAICGPSDLMMEMEEIFFSSTFGGETLSLAASLAVIEKMEQTPVIDKLWQVGDTLGRGAEEILTAHSLGDIFSFKGLAPWKLIAIGSHESAGADAISTVFRREMLKNGVLVCGSHNVSAALTNQDIDHVLNAYEKTARVIVQELDAGDLDQRLDNTMIKPVFKVR